MVDAGAEVVAEGPGGVMVRLRWRDSGCRGAFEMFQVLRLRDGQIVDMQDYERRRPALRALGRAI